MVQTAENIIKIQQAATSGNYQIVCRQVFGSLNSWYITNTDITDWNWTNNEYRIYVGTKEPPMINEMNDYSVYFCGYNYYFLEDGEVKKQVNVNVAQDVEAAPYFKANHLLTDKISPLEQDFVETESLKAADIETASLKVTDIETEGLKATDIETEGLKATDIETESLKATDIETASLKVTDIETESLKANNLVDLVYPVGSIYMSVNNVSPAVFIGGTWVQIEDTFLLTAGSTYAAGSTGGEATHTLTEEEMPSHSHSYSFEHSHSGSVQNGGVDHTHIQQTVKYTDSHEEEAGSDGDNGTVWETIYDAPIAGPSIYGNGDCYGAYDVTGDDFSYSRGGWSTKGQYISTLGADRYLHQHGLTIDSTNVSGATGSTGNENEHNNMPPYLTVYCWTRIE